LSFEYEFYREARRCIPKTGAKVETEQGPGRLKQLDVVRGRAVVALDEGGELELPLEALARHKPGCPHWEERGKEQVESEGGKEEG